MRFLLTILFVVLTNCAFAQISSTIFNNGDTLSISVDKCFNTKLKVEPTRSSCAFVSVKVVGMPKHIYRYLKAQGVLEPKVVGGVMTFPGLESPMVAKINGNLKQPITFVVTARFPG